jgi:cystathionine gamma-synthase
MRLETIAVHAGHDVDATTGAVTPPIYLSTTFSREVDGSYRSGLIYSRYANPNRTSLERCLASLEGGVGAATFASGSAATMSLIQALGPRTHVLAPDDAYYGTIRLVREMFAPWGVELTTVDMGDLSAVRAAMRDTTRLVWMETPSNPLLRVSDIRGVAQIAHERGASCAVDNTWATPHRARRRRGDARHHEIPGWA